MTREIYNGANHTGSIKKDIITGNIIENYKENNDNDSTDVLTTAQDGELIHGARAIKTTKKGSDYWYLEFQDGKKDGPYQKIEYDREYIYCTILFSLAYRYELNGLLQGIGSEYGYYAYIKKFVEDHKEEYDRYKSAQGNLLNAYSIGKAQRYALFERDYYHQRQQYEEKRSRRAMSKASQHYNYGNGMLNRI